MGLQPRRHVDCDGPCRPATRKGRSHPIRASPRMYGVGRRVQVRAVMGTTRKALTLAVIFLGGMAAATVIAFARHMATSDVTILLAWAVGGAAACSCLAGAGLWLARRSPVKVQATIAVLAPIVVVAIGVGGAAHAMFIASHDLWVLSVVLVGAGTVGIITAFVVGTRVVTMATAMNLVALHIGDDTHDPLVSTPDGSPAS